ncbi:hypothetical protein [Flavobacterium sp.]|uniref:hypothetical protein n=1 Tax=Flavobacterium sp. TaxID=239 RepID=UPI002FDB69BE
MKNLFLLIQSDVIDEKLKNAPDGDYQIGIWIGSLLPFVVLVGLAYWMYYTAKKKEKNN